MSVPDFDFQFDPRRIPEISQKYKYDPRGVVASVISPSVMVKRSRSSQQRLERACPSLCRASAADPKVPCKQAV